MITAHAQQLILAIFVPALRLARRFEFSAVTSRGFWGVDTAGRPLSLEVSEVDFGQTKEHEREKMDQNVRVLLGRIRTQLGSVLRDSVSLFLLGLATPTDGQR